MIMSAAKHRSGGAYQRHGDGLFTKHRAALYLESYEKELSHALWWACTNAFLHALSRFFAICILTSASVILLSSLRSYLLLRDSVSIACLVVLETIRLLLSASFFLRLSSCSLFTQARLSQNPRHINHAHFPVMSNFNTRFCLQILQMVLIFPSVAIPFLHIFASEYSNLEVRNLQSLLRIFYSLVAVNSFAGFGNLLCSVLAYASLYKPEEHSILKYYDRVLENVIRFGIVQTADFEFFSFAYTLLGSEYRRNVQPQAIAKSYQMLIRYLYAHRLGFDALQIYMDADDAFVQQAAANMVGFWAVDTGLSKVVTFPEELLMKLADMVGTGQVGWAATSSFGALAGKPEGACLVARTTTGSGVRLPDHLADLVDPTSCRSLALVRTLARFYEQLCAREKGVLPKPFKEQAERELLAKLRRLAREARVQRLRVQAAYLLLMMGEECDPNTIIAIDPMQDAYWFRSEVSMLHLLRQGTPYHASPLQLQYLAIREDADIITPAPWLS